MSSSSSKTFSWICCREPQDGGSDAHEKRLSMTCIHLLQPHRLKDLMVPPPFHQICVYRFATLVCSLRVSLARESMGACFGCFGTSTSMLESILEENASKKIQFEGSRFQDFRPSVDVIVSFPGAHGFAWNLLTQRSLESGSNLLTSCVFLPNSDADGYGVHYPLDGSQNKCYCQKLYGRRQEFGCTWYAKWMLKTVLAAQYQCKLIVVTKMSGSLGRSQEGEVRFLQDSGFAFVSIDILEFAKKHSPKRIAEELRRQEETERMQKIVKDLRLDAHFLHQSYQKVRRKSSGQLSMTLRSHRSRFMRSRS